MDLLMVASDVRESIDLVLRDDAPCRRANAFTDGGSQFLDARECTH